MTATVSALPWYEDIEVLRKRLNNLADFYEWQAARRAARTADDKTLLKVFVLKGNWLCDEFAQVGRLGQDCQNPKLPTILTREEFLEYSPRYSYGFGGSDTHLPQPNVECALCKKLWTLDNIHDVHTECRHDTLLGQEFLGLTLTQVREALSKKRDACYFMQPDVCVRNDRWIDLTADPKYPSLVMNEKGWASSDVRRGHPTIDYDNYVLQEGDELFVNKWTYYHVACWERHLHGIVREEFRKSFEDAGLKVELVRVKNEYGSGSYNGPWFLADVDECIYKVGWRKRVITIGQHYPNETPHVHLGTYAELTKHLKELHHA